MLAEIQPVSDTPEYPIRLADRQGEPFLIRPYSQADLRQLEAFYVEFEPKRAAQGLPPEGLARIRRWLDPILPLGVHLVVYREAELIGHALMVPTEEESTAEYAVFLRASDRGRGIGTELNRASVVVARAAGLRRLWLTVAPLNRAAIRSYENAGFRFRPGTILSAEAEMELDLAAP